VSASWRLDNDIKPVAENLYGQYKDGFMQVDHSNVLRHRNLVAGQLAVEF
jgi:hypothetical protein